MYTTEEHGMGRVLFCVPPSFVLMKNKNDNSYAITRSK